MVVLARDWIVCDFGSAGVAAGDAHQRNCKPFYLVWIVILEPFRVMHSPEWPVQGEFQMLETAMGPGRFFIGHPVFEPSRRRIENRLKMRLAQKRGTVARLLMQVRSHAWRVDRQWNAVGDHTVSAHVLPRDHCRARRHADHVLV